MTNIDKIEKYTEIAHKLHFFIKNDLEGDHISGCMLGNLTEHIFSLLGFEDDE